MAKSWPLIFAPLLLTAVALLHEPSGFAQLPTDVITTGCPSGMTLSADGTCVSSQSQNTNQAPQGTQGLSSDELTQQYPGLQRNGNANPNAQPPSFYDQSGLTGLNPEQMDRFQASQLARLLYEPPTGFQQLVRASVGKLLPVYGDSLFRRVPTTFAPLNQIPVTSDYVIGPGDQLVIRVWGQVSFNAQVTVDRSGAVYLPQVGSVHVAGLPFAQVQQQLKTATSRIYKNFTMDVQMGQLRSIQVFVVGQARRPGTYTLSSLSTLVTAVFATGGPSVEGSLRDIQLKRSGQPTVHYDLYDLLVHGDKSRDLPLLPGDVIYIPPAGAQVAVSGSVRNPAIYELNGQTTVGQLLDFAGGLSPEALNVRASLDRIDAHRARATVDVPLDAGGMTTPVKDGDILRVLPISPEFQKTILLRGNVAEPGRFGWHEGMKLSEVLPDSQSLITRDYWERRNRLGIPGPTFRAEDATNPDFYPTRENGYPAGQQYPYQYPGQYQGQYQGQYPGQYPGPNGEPTDQYGQQNTQYTQDQQNTPNQPLNTGGTQGQIYAQGSAADLARRNAQQGNAPQSNLGGTALGTEQMRQIGQGTALTRPPLKIALPVPEIDWSYAVIERQNPTTLTTTLVPFNLGALVLHHDASQDLTLEPGDVVTIFSQADIRVPQAQRTKFVRLEGEFTGAGVYSAKPGETLRQLVARAGGFTPKAYLFGSEFTRESTRVIQQQRLNDYISNLELEINRATIAATTGISPQDTAAAVAASQSLVDRFRTLRATGRIVLNIAPDSTGLESLPDLPLEDGDRFVVPSQPDTVNVVGAVYDQNSFLFHAHERLAPYLRMAGGPTRDADNTHAFIIRADGSVVSRQSAHGVFGNTFTATPLFPGDTIVVPEKVARPSSLRSVINLTQLFSQVALGAASIAVVYR